MFDLKEQKRERRGNEREPGDPRTERSSSQNKKIQKGRIENGTNE